MPRSLKLLWPPVIVNVFPLPVCPYANMVPLKPSSAPSIMGLATASNTVSCFVPVSNVWLNVKSKWSRELLITPGACSTGTSNVILRSSSVYLTDCYTKTWRERSTRTGTLASASAADGKKPRCCGLTWRSVLDKLGKGDGV